MAVTDTQLLLRMEASLAKFEKQMARGREVGASTAKGIEQQFANSNRKMAQNAEASAAAIGREMDRLRAKYDPVYAASKKYEAALEELNRAQKVGAISSAQHEAALERLNAEYAQSTGMAQRAAVSTTALASANTRVAATTRGMGGGIQNLAYQVGDFAVQVGAGTSATMALGQQLPQLLGGFGILGAVLGAVVAIAVPLGSALLSIGDAGETMEDKIDALKKAVDDYTAATENAMMPTADLAEKYGVATAAAREFIGALRDITEVDALAAVSAALDKISTSLGNFNATRNMFGGEREADAVRRLREDLGVSADKAQAVADALQDLGRAEGPERQANAALAFLAALEDGIGSYEDMNAVAKTFYRLTRDAGEEAAQLAGAADGAAGAIGGAASEAGRLADELGRAVNNAMNLAMQGVSDTRRAQIEYDFRDDPKGRTAALARERFDAQVDLPEGADSTLVNVVEEQRRAFVGAAVDAEEYRQKLKAWQDQQREATKEAKKAGGGRKRTGRKGREEPGLFEASDEELLSIERKIGMIGKEASEIAGLNAKYALLDEAKRRGLDLDSQIAGTGETLRDQIERQAAAVGDLAEQYDSARERADFFAEAQHAVQDGMIDAILEGENLAGVLADVAKMFARAALQASLFGEGPFSNGGAGGGLLGSLMDGIGGFLGGGGKPLDAAGLLSGGRAAGGPVTAGRIYKVGEHGPEPFFPAVNGRILSTAQAQQALSGGGSGAVAPTVNVSVTNLNKDVQVETRRGSGGSIELVVRRVMQGAWLDGSMDSAVSQRHGLTPRAMGT